jgi:hypothetical protein
VPWRRYLFGTVILFVGCGAIYGALQFCMGLGLGQSRTLHVPPTADERAVITHIITTMQDEIAGVEEIVADSFRDAMKKAAPNVREKVRNAWMYRAGFAERWLRYKLEGRSNDEICDAEGAAWRPYPGL